MNAIVMILALVAIFIGTFFPEEGGLLLLVFGAALLMWSLHRLSGRLLRARAVAVRRMRP